MKLDLMGNNIGDAKVVVLLVLLVCSLCSRRVCAVDVHASIKNMLGNGNMMSIHCQSKDNDLGNQTVSDGSEFGWDFSPNVWGTTLFYCDLDWKNVSDFYFDAYAFARDSVRCKTLCSWLVSGEGMYGFNEGTGLWEFMYNWPS
ncbi:self-incompatibility protein S1-like [Actinidia eriantha]|uniref:self-incompatibility protein S1-like n=1 Tax=Actinidia eriantha TaxID=165200 RepID=UPI0025907DB4|nr:self-incompatibility protein S1-like [Actinidia eriantha]